MEFVALIHFNNDKHKNTTCVSRRILFTKQNIYQLSCNKFEATDKNITTLTGLQNKINKVDRPHKKMSATQEYHSKPEEKGFQQQNY